MANTSNLKPWKPGESGNRKGRPPGKGMHAQAREALTKRLPELLEVLMQSALAGDVQAARLLLERCMPSIKPVEQTVELALPDVGATLSQQATDVLSAVARGELAPTQGAQLVGAIGAVAKVVETDELKARIERLEAAHGNT